MAMWPRALGRWARVVETEDVFTGFFFDKAILGILLRLPSLPPKAAGRKPGLLAAPVAPASAILSGNSVLMARQVDSGRSGAPDPPGSGSSRRWDGQFLAPTVADIALARNFPIVS